MSYGFKIFNFNSPEKKGEKTKKDPKIKHKNVITSF